MHNHVSTSTSCCSRCITEEVPRVAADERVEVEELEHGFCARASRATASWRRPTCPRCSRTGTCPATSLEHTTFFLGRETVLATERPGMALWREQLFAFLSRNAQPATRSSGSRRIASSSSARRSRI